MRSNPPSKIRPFEVVLMITALFVISGCASVGPDFQSPAPTSPQAWHTDLKNGLKVDAPEADQLQQWWQVLEDPILSDLIKRAVDGNYDLKQATIRVREARIRRGISSANQFPTLDLTGSAVKNRTSASTGYGTENDIYTAGFDALWELDIFGGVRRQVEVADANLAASQADLDAVRVSIAAEVALNYLDVRTYQTRLEVALANITAQQETFDLINSRFTAGLSNELEVQQAQYNLSITRAQIPTLRTGLEAAKNRLAILIGQPPGSLHERLRQSRAIPVPPTSVAVGVPAEVLRRRPDIRRAEKELAAQSARIGVATADLYPRFHLLGSIGQEVMDGDNFFDSDNRYYTVGPSISWRLFNAGAIRQNIEVQSVVFDQYLLAYETTVLTALEEVENALTRYVEEQFRRERLLEAVNAARKASDLAKDQYQAGLVDFSNVLEAQRSLLSYQDQLAQSDGSVTTNLIGLYKALGGGWEPMEEKKEK